MANMPRRIKNFDVIFWENFKNSKIWQKLYFLSPKGSGITFFRKHPHKSLLKNIFLPFTRDDRFGFWLSKWLHRLVLPWQDTEYLCKMYYIKVVFGLLSSIWRDPKRPQGGLLEGAIDFLCQSISFIIWNRIWSVWLSLRFCSFVTYSVVTDRKNKSSSTTRWSRLCCILSPTSFGRRSLPA